jgi:subtilisin family serine protease
LIEMRMRLLWGPTAIAAAFSAFAPSARAQHPDGAALVRLLGTRAKDVFAPRGAPGLGALVRVPGGQRAASLGLQEVAPGFARVWGAPADIVAFADAHPGLSLEVVPPLHLLLDTAGGYVGAATVNATGHQGKNVLIGIADTGIDLTHPNFRDSAGTRVAWLLDLSSPPIGKHPELERMYGSTDASGNLALGAVWAKSDIDALLVPGGRRSSLPHDEVGHGTLVASCAAGADPVYSGVAPKAGLLIARITGQETGSIGNDELLRGVAFLFDRADFMQQPVVVNLSIGTDFGPHDGTLDWEQALAAQVGPTHPGHAIVAAAGNSGSIAEMPVHQNVHASRGATTRIPIVTGGADSGSVQVWVALHSGAHLSVGLDGPDGTWIAPVAENDSAGKNESAYSAAIYNGGESKGSPVPKLSRGAVVVWQGKWRTGTYFVTLSGTGTADLYVQATGDAVIPGVRTVGFADGVREGTINLPATHPQILGVGCTINKASWRSAGGNRIGLLEPVLDAAGGTLDPNAMARDPTGGQPCWFSSAGPTLTGVPKPEIMAPGAAIVGALSQQAIPPAQASIFTNDCPGAAAGSTGDIMCQEVDQRHGVSFGTSFSAPLVAGAVAILLEHDPMLTQADVTAALQSGAHPLRGAAPFDDQAGAGELDVAGALAAVDRIHDPQLAIPIRPESWMTLGADVYLADGSTPLQAVIELRAARTRSGPPPPADGFGDGRLAAYFLVRGVRHDAPVRRIAPGVWMATIQLAAGFGGASLTVGATFDGAEIVDTKTVPIATDAWNAKYPASVAGGCATARGGREKDGGRFSVVVGVGAAIAARRRRRDAP